MVLNALKRQYTLLRMSLGSLNIEKEKSHFDPGNNALNQSKVIVKIMF